MKYETWNMLLDCGFIQRSDDYFIHPDLPGIKVSVIHRKLFILAGSIVISENKIECTEKNVQNLIKAFNP